MKKLIVVTSLVATGLFSASKVEAKPASAEQNIGVASGAAIGAAAGGPIGFIIGAAIGGLLGEKVEQANEVDAMSAQLELAEVEMQTLVDENSSLKNNIAAMESNKSLDGSDMLQMDFLFMTNASELDDLDRERIIQLAHFMNKYDGLAIQLDGFADPRGNVEKNQSLSQARIDSIVSLLVEEGVDPARLFSKAHGETASVAPEGDIDAYALERRVSIRFTHTETPALASNQ